MPTGPRLSEQFMVLFNNLKEAAGNTPERVRVYYKDSTAIRSAYHRLNEFLARSDIERRIFHSSKLIVLRAPGFEAAWKEYNDHWRFRVIWPELTEKETTVDFDIDELLRLPTEPRQMERGGPQQWFGEQLEYERQATPDQLSPPDPEIEDAFDELRHDGSAAIELGIQWLETWAANERDPTGNASRIAVGAYDYLVNTVGLDASDVFRRWRNLPIIFIPTHITNHYGATDKGSLPHLLNDAVRAYVFGAPAAAIAMCRAALEMVLKNHYGQGQWNECDLAKVISMASKKYKFVREGQSHRFRRMANKVMHEYNSSNDLSQEEEKVIIDFFVTLKSLIQKSPPP